MQEYYSCATQCNLDFSKLGYILSRTIHNRLKRFLTDQGTRSTFYQKRYTGQQTTQYINGIALFPVNKVNHKTGKLMCFSQKVTPYTVEGREKLHQEIRQNLTEDLHWIACHPLPKESMEYNDNRLSVWMAQQGKCFITGQYVGTVFDCHHIQPRSQAGKDTYQNLVILMPEIHKVVHTKEADTISKSLCNFDLKKNQQKRLNQLREQVGLNLISY